MVGQMIASYSFAANATVMKADDRITRMLLNITA
jgi:flagellar basal-body rod protein FlgC